MPIGDVLDDLLVYSLIKTYGLYPSEDLLYEYDFLDDHMAWFRLACRNDGTNILIKVDHWQLPLGI